MSREPQEILRDALLHFEMLQSYASRDLEDQLVIDAICMRLSAGIEVLATLSLSDRERLFGEVWPLMWGMRNRIAHGYLLVNPAIIRQTIEHDIPVIMSAITAEPEGAQPNDQA